MSDDNIVPTTGNVEPTPTPTEVVINPEVGNTPPTETPSEPPAPRVFTQDEVDRIVTKRLSKAERAWERQNRQILETALSHAQRSADPAPAPSNDGEPDPAKYEHYTDYVRDLARYESRQAMAKTEQQNAQQRQQDTAKQREAKIQQNLAQKMEAASNKYDDFEDVVMSSDLPISPGMAEIIAESDIGGELAYYLGKNRNEAARIAALSPLAAAKELGKIESKLAVAPAPEVSSAPTPPTPVGNRSTAPKDPDKMTVEEWTAWRNDQLSKKRRA